MGSEMKLQERVISLIIWTKKESSLLYSHWTSKRNDSRRWSSMIKQMHNKIACSDRNLGTLGNNCFIKCFIIGASIMAQQVKPQSATPVTYTREVVWVSILHFWANAPLMCLAVLWKMAPVLWSLPVAWKTWMEFLFLASAWSSTGSCSHLESK